MAGEVANFIEWIIVAFIAFVCYSWVLTSSMGNRGHKDGDGSTTEGLPSPMTDSFLQAQKVSSPSVTGKYTKTSSITLMAQNVLLPLPASDRQIKDAVRLFVPHSDESEGDEVYCYSEEYVDAEISSEELLKNSIDTEDWDAINSCDEAMDQDDSYFEWNDNSEDDDDSDENEENELKPSSNFLVIRESRLVVKSPIPQKSADEQRDTKHEMKESHLTGATNREEEMHAPPIPKQQLSVGNSTILEGSEQATSPNIEDAGLRKKFKKDFLKYKRRLEDKTQNRKESEFLLQKNPDELKNRLSNTNSTMLPTPFIPKAIHEPADSPSRRSNRKEQLTKTPYIKLRGRQALDLTKDWNEEFYLKRDKPGISQAFLNKAKSVKSPNHQSPIAQSDLKTDLLPKRQKGESGQKEKREENDSSTSRKIEDDRQGFSEKAGKVLIKRSREKAAISLTVGPSKSQKYGNIRDTKMIQSLQEQRNETSMPLTTPQKQETKTSRKTKQEGNPETLEHSLTTQEESRKIVSIRRGLEDEFYLQRKSSDTTQPRSESLGSSEEKTPHAGEAKVKQTIESTTRKAEKKIPSVSPPTEIRRGPEDEFYVKLMKGPKSEETRSAVVSSSVGKSSEGGRLTDTEPRTVQESSTKQSKVGTVRTASPLQRSRVTSGRSSRSSSPQRKLGSGRPSPKVSTSTDIDKVKSLPQWEETVSSTSTSDKTETITADKGNSNQLEKRVSSTVTSEKTEAKIMDKVNTDKLEKILVSTKIEPQPGPSKRKQK